jgi:hypothetical protein
MEKIYLTIMQVARLESSRARLAKVKNLSLDTLCRDD